MRCIHARVQSMQNLYIMNTFFSEHFLVGPVGVHYREVLLYVVYVTLYHTFRILFYEQSFIVVFCVFDFNLLKSNDYNTSHLIILY
jgi:hypothetical protein